MSSLGEVVASLQRQIAETYPRLIADPLVDEYHVASPPDAIAGLVEFLHPWQAPDELLELLGLTFVAPATLFSATSILRILRRSRRGIPLTTVPWISFGDTPGCSWATPASKTAEPFAPLIVDDGDAGSVDVPFRTLTSWLQGWTEALRLASKYELDLLDKESRVGFEIVWWRPYLTAESNLRHRPYPPEFWDEINAVLAEIRSDAPIPTAWVGEELYMGHESFYPPEWPDGWADALGRPAGSF